MKKFKGYIPTMTMFALLLIGATSARAGVIINSIADTDTNSGKTTTAVSDGVIINSIIGVIINSITGNYSVAPGIMVSD